MFGSKIIIKGVVRKEESPETGTYLVTLQSPNKLFQLIEKVCNNCFEVF